MVIQRTIEKPNQFGFRFNVIAGSGVPEITAAYGLFRSCTTTIAHHVDIPEMYLSYIAPLGKGLRFDAGLDLSNKDVFQRRDTLVGQQFTSAINLIYLF